LNLSQSYFVAPISNSQMQEIFAFENQVDDDNMSTSSGEDFAVAPLAALTSKTTRWMWEPQHKKAFAMAKRAVAKEQ